MLLLELIQRISSSRTEMLALTMEAFAIEETPEEPVGVGIPAAVAFLGLSFAGCALVIAGLPPLSGFVAKFGLFHALLNPDTPSTSVTPMTWALIALVVLSGWAAIISMLRFGVRTFWAAGDIKPPKLPATEVAPISLLLLLCIVLTVQAAPVFAYLQRASDDLHWPEKYIERVTCSPGLVRQ